MRIGQAELRLHRSLERRRRVLGEAAMRGIDPVDRHPTFAGEPEERADAIHGPEHNKAPTVKDGGGDAIEMKYPGDDLFSQEVAPRVSSALESLTSVFGMGTGGTSPLASPG